VQNNKYNILTLQHFITYGVKSQQLGLKQAPCSQIVLRFWRGLQQWTKGAGPVSPIILALYVLNMRSVYYTLRWTSRRRRQYLFSGNVPRPIFRLQNDAYCVGWGVKLYSTHYSRSISSVILSPNLLCCLCSDFVISDTIIDLFFTLL